MVSPGILRLVLGCRKLSGTAKPHNVLGLVHCIATNVLRGYTQRRTNPLPKCRVLGLVLTCSKQKRSSYKPVPLFPQPVFACTQRGVSLHRVFAPGAPSHASSRCPGSEMPARIFPPDRGIFMKGLVVGLRHYTSRSARCTRQHRDVSCSGVSFTW